jgi:hypothetical protein
MPNRPLRLTALLAVACAACTPAAPAVTTPRPGPEAPAALADKPNTHGMFMLGASTLYLAHMPMFHKADHQYQVILRAHLDAAATRTYLADRAANPAQAYNLINVDEEPFILPDLKAGKVRTFHVNVFRGYSNDNGGTPGPQIAARAELTVDEIVRFRHFDPAAARPERLAYFLFGDGAEAHLDHTIAGEPDFQQVLTLPAVPAWASKEQLQKGVDLVFPVPAASVRCEAPLREASYPVTQAGSAGAPVPLQVGAAASRWFSTGNMLNAKDPCDTSAPAHPM